MFHRSLSSLSTLVLSLLLGASGCLLEEGSPARQACRGPNCGAATTAAVGQALEEDADTSVVDPLAVCTQESCVAAEVGPDAGVASAEAPPPSASEAPTFSEPPPSPSVPTISDNASSPERDAAQASLTLATARVLKDDGNGGACPQVGEWKEAGKTCTLLADLDQPIVIQSDNIKLDCAGHAISGGTEGIGILIEGAVGVTVENCRVSGFATGLLARDSSRLNVKGNIFGRKNADGTYEGGGSTDNIHLLRTSQSTVVGNSLHGAGRINVLLSFSPNNEVRGNRSEGGNHGIILQTSDDNEIRANIVVANRVSGIGAWATWTPPITGNKFTGNTVRDNGANGILVQDAVAFRIEENIISGSGASNIWLLRTSNSAITGNDSRGATHNGVGMSSCEGNEISNNTLVANTARGIWMTSSHRNVVRGNRMEGAKTESGIYLNSSEENEVSDNVIVNNEMDGIILRSSHRNTIAGNQIQDSNREDGIDLKDSNENTISGNHITNSPQRGILAVRSHRNVLRGNRIEGSENRGVVLSASDDNQVLENTIINNKQGGIELADWHDPRVNSGNVIRGNFISDNTWFGIRLRVSKSTWVTSNTIERHPRSGIFVEVTTTSDWATQNVIEDNTVSGNGLAYTGDTAGIEVRGRYTTVSGNMLSGNRHGIFVNAHDNQVVGNVACDNPGLDTDGDGLFDGTGIYVDHSKRVTVQNNQTCRNARDGIRLEGAGLNSAVQGNRSWDNGGAGLSLVHTRRVTASDNHLADNTTWGLLLEESSRENKINGNVMLRSGDAGLRIVETQNVNRNYDRINGNAVVDSGGPGVQLAENPRPSFIYNNVFLNAWPIEFQESTVNVPFYWTAQPVARPNVVGGPSIGGNWWGNRAGTFPSQTWADADTDGFTDVGLLLRSFPVYDADYRPLASATLTFCHRPWKSQSAAVTIQLDPTETDPVTDHLNHGDKPGPCP